MVEAGAKEVAEEEIVQALEHAHIAIKEIVAGIEALAAGSRQAQDEGQGAKEIDAAFRRDVEARAYGPLAEAMRIKDKLENYGKVDSVLAELVAGIPGRRAGASAPTPRRSSRS